MISIKNYYQFINESINDLKEGDYVKCLLGSFQIKGYIKEIDNNNHALVIFDTTTEDGRIHKGNKSGWFFLNRLTKIKKVEHIFTPEDPYGEEIWENKSHYLEIDLQYLIKKYNTIQAVYDYLLEEIPQDYKIYKMKYDSYETNCVKIYVKNNELCIIREWAGGPLLSRFCKNDILVKKNFILYFKTTPLRVYTKEDPYGEEDWDD